MNRPGESDEDKRARLQERAMAERERKMAAQGTAKDLSTDLNSVYGRNTVSMFDMMGVQPVGGTQKKKAAPSAWSFMNNPIGR